MFYIGFLKTDVKHVVIFKSVKKPQKGDFRYFVHVVGSYATEQEARNDLRYFSQCKENPIKGMIKKGDIIRAIALTRKVARLYGKIRKQNPGVRYHNQKFIKYIHESYKYVIGSAQYLITLAKAYEHLQSAKDSV